MSTEEKQAIDVPEETRKEEEEEPKEEEESTATFEPVVKLEEVEVKSGEEDEEVLISIRSKLFIFGETLLDKGTGKKSWRERGIGEAKILRHKEHQRLRLLMRQEKTMKVIANHVLDPRIKLQPNAGSDRSWVWSAFDFAEGELVETVFALRFPDSEIAENFKVAFENGQKEMERLLAGEDKPGEDGGAAADEVAEALGGLKTSDNEQGDAKEADEDKTQTDKEEDNDKSNEE
mmetsp:Transcript_7800/g.14699  ORF Transcript_7800/g.14699 Transcript_7800/m.14699 type:complete len:233 (-) Transcript_7800:69-767(-)